MTAELAKPEYHAMHVVATERFSPGDISIAAQLARIRAAGAQFIVTYNSGAPFGIVIRGMRDAGIDLPVFTSPGNLSYVELKAYGENLPRRLFFVSGPLAAGRTGDRERAAEGDGLRRSSTRSAAQARGRIGATPSAWDTGAIVIAALRARGLRCHARPTCATYINGVCTACRPIQGLADFRNGDGRGVSDARILAGIRPATPGRSFPARAARRGADWRRRTMLTREENELLCRVGADAPMGRMLRRYWIPAALSTRARSRRRTAAHAAASARIWSRFAPATAPSACSTRHCPHRGASLVLARNEDCALRCLYHGWKIAPTARVLETPAEPGGAPLSRQVRARAYPVYEDGGIVWAYLGPPGNRTAAHALRLDVAAGRHRMITKVHEDCNWVQSLEGVIDSAHSNFLHANRIKPAGRSA